MFEFIEKVVYINLNERTDRREAVETELLRVFPAEKIERFAAIRNAKGAIGCSLSHITVLERAKAAGWSNVLVVEDDMLWNTPAELEQSAAHVKRIVEGSEGWDVVMLGGTFVGCNKEGRVRVAQSGVSYLVCRDYYDTLIANLREGITGLIRGGDYKVFALDQYWKRLQPRDRWWVALPMACYQRPDFSDIEGKVVDYRRYFFAEIK
jgi:glycosyl transferase family 25